MQHRFGAFNQRFQADSPNRQADVLLDLGKQSISEEHIVCILDFGQDHDINRAAGCLYHVDHVTVEKPGVWAVDAESTDFAAEIESLERLYQGLARGDLL